jgi:hypothetical protein
MPSDASNGIVYIYIPRRLTPNVQSQQSLSLVLVSPLAASDDRRMMMTSPPEHQHASSADRKKYKGVRRRKWGRWVSEIRLPNSRERIWLGSYDTEEKAARAFDAAFVCLRGPGAVDGLNFPSSPPAVPRTSDPNEVFAIAASYASNNQAAAAIPPRDQEAMMIDGPAPSHDDDGVLAQLQVPAAMERFDWSEFVHNPPPLYSPTVTMGSHGMPLTADDVINMDETDRGAFLSLWSFDSAAGSCSLR